MQDFLEPLLSVEIIGNNLAAWVIAILGAVVTGVALVTLRRRLIRDFDRRSFLIADVTTRLARATQGFFIAAASLAALLYLLDLPSKVAGMLSAVVTVGVMVQIAVWCTTLLEYWIAYSVMRRAANDPGSASAAQIIKFLGQAVIWTTLLLLTLGNFGINITGLVAGLGIGGIAIAFALQSILKDLFASLAIVLDKPLWSATSSSLAISLDRLSESG
jgi:small-conductance mechanosensitive channel